MKLSAQGIIFMLILSGALFLWGCSGESSGDTGAQTQTAQSSNPDGLTDWELKNGIGPIKSPVTLGDIDQALVTRGGEVFEAKCTACHKMNERYIGPPLDDVTSKRTPEYVMNMILNPDEMTKKHPDAKKLLAEYLAPMTFQNISEDDARALLEYFRANAK